jgi:hypothetical protein
MEESGKEYIEPIPENDEDEFEYPEECKVLDIMKTKYVDAISFFYDTDDKK